MSLEQLAAKPVAQFLADYKRIAQARNAPARPINRSPADRDWLLVASVPEPDKAPPSLFIVGDILQAAAHEFLIPLADMKSERRTKVLSEARRCCYVILKAKTRLSYPSIGRIFGRCHSSIMTSIQAHEAQPEILFQRIKKIMEALG